MDEQTNYDKNVNRLAGFAVFIIVALIIVAFWFITNHTIKGSTNKAIDLAQAHTTDISKLRDLKFVKSYNEHNTIDNFDYITLGKYNNRDIEWLILSAKDGEALVISKYVLKSIPFGYDDKIGFMQDWWRESNVRDWLNNVFYNEAFSDSEKGKIIEKGGNPFPLLNHPEKLKILDNGEIKKFFGEIDKKVIANHTKTKLFPGVSDNDIDLSPDGYVPYWSRTVNKDRASAVNNIGDLNTEGYLPTNTTIGVRPAMYIKY